MKQQRALRTYQQTLDAAAAEFVRSGYSRTSLSAVVKRTGMTKGALYGHFSSKEALAATLVADGARAYARAVDRAVADAGSAVEALRLGVLGLLRALDTDIRLRAALRLAVESTAEVAGARELIDSLTGFLREHAAAAQQRGEVPKTCAVGAITSLLLVVVVGYERLLHSSGLGIDPRELRDTRLFLDHLIRAAEPSGHA